LRQSEPSTAVSAPSVTLPPQATETLQSVERKREAARQELDKLTRAERREAARKLGLLTEEEVDAILHTQEKSWCAGGKGQRVRVDTNQVASNSPIEDYLAWSELGPDRLMFGVFDGHAGYMCAEQLAQRLAPMLNRSMALAAAESDDQDVSALASTVRQLQKEAGRGWDHTALALTATFINMDRELVQDALAEFRRSQDLARIDALLGPAVSGSCGLVAVVDSNEVVVANTGDSRALLGVRLADGRWRAVRLSEDQTADNAQERARLSREHPGEVVLQKNRVLGGLMPTRAFGDSRYKWALETQQDLFP
ncbi:[Pyruvate dehydrogenase [acetyl-transferring]]-phosphatase 1, mitochondrial, partial [Linderina pennispora]